MAAPLVIGLSGGVASGKSTVARMFAELGAVVLDADRIGHEVLEEEEVKRELYQTWGERIFDHGEVNRKTLGKIVFDPKHGTEQLAWLERITHPRIERRIRERLAELTSEPCPAVVLDAPLLFKAGWDELCKELVYVEANQRVRLNRAMVRGWSQEEFQERENRQMPLSVKRERSTEIIDNSNGLANTLTQVRGMWRKWGLKIPLNPDR